MFVFLHNILDAAAGQGVPKLNDVWNSQFFVGLLTLIGKKSLKWPHTFQFLTNLDLRPPDGCRIHC